MDYYNDRNAPRANSLVPSVTAVARDDAGRLLMVHREDGDHWTLPGGAMRVGETVAETAMREVAEQTGLRVEITGLVGIYSSPGHVTAFDDGEVRQELVVCLHARPSGGERRSAEWFEVGQLDELAIHPFMRTRINDALNDRARPRIA